MSIAAAMQNLSDKPKALSGSAGAGLILQRKCTCGSPITSVTDVCTNCKSIKGLQTKLIIGRPDDRLELEADRVADRVLAAPRQPEGSCASQWLQSFHGRAAEYAETAPESIDQVLASSGTPLEPRLRHEMEQRFGHDFSEVRVHSDLAAERSARDIGAVAYTVGRHIVFGTGSFKTDTYGGKRLVAHELTHVLQQSGGKQISADQIPGSMSDRTLWRSPDVGAPVSPSGAKLKYKYKMSGYKPSTGSGHFDEVEYNSRDQVLTITIRARFSFPPLNISQLPVEIRGDPEAVARAMQEYQQRKEANIVSFVWQAEGWGGHHVFFCHEPGARALRASTRVEVQVIRNEEPTSATESITQVSVGEDRADQRAHTHPPSGAVSTQLGQGYTSQYDEKTNRMISRPVGPPLSLRGLGESGPKDEMPFVGRPGIVVPEPAQPKEQLTFMHELGHVFGLGDEYIENADPEYARGRPTQHSKLAKAMLGKDVVHGRDDKSVMALGNEIRAEHGVTFLEALQKVTGMRWGFEPAEKNNP